MQVILFDRVKLTRRGTRVTCTVDEFLRLPLSDRTAHILQHDVEFFRGQETVDPTRALASLRAISAHPDKPKVLALSDEPDFENSVAALEGAGYYILVVTQLTELVNALPRFKPDVLVVNLQTAVLDEEQVTGFVGRSRRIVFLSDVQSTCADETHAHAKAGDPGQLVIEVSNALRLG